MDLRLGIPLEAKMPLIMVPHRAILPSSFQPSVVPICFLRSSDLASGLCHLPLSLKGFLWLAEDVLWTRVLGRVSVIPKESGRTFFAYLGICFSAAKALEAMLARTFIYAGERERRERGQSVGSGHPAWKAITGGRRGQLGCHCLVSLAEALS